MRTVDGELDPGLLLILALVAFGAVLVAALVAWRVAVACGRHARPEDVERMQRLEVRIALVERRHFAEPAPESHALEHTLLPAEADVTETGAAGVMSIPIRAVASIEALNIEAAKALSSRDNFQRFTQIAGGNGLTLRTDAKGAGPVLAPDAVSASDLWKVPYNGVWLVYPGFNLLRSQSALLADAGRMAQDRLGWLFDIEAGERLSAFRPAILALDNTVIERGTLHVPL